MKRLLLSILLTALPVAAMAATTWFVDARNGSNGYSGLSPSVPKRTIQAAVNAAAGGDCIVVAGGVYYENVTLSVPPASAAVPFEWIDERGLAPRGDF